VDPARQVMAFSGAGEKVGASSDVVAPLNLQAIA
jgi:hypothetical protein